MKLLAIDPGNKESAVLVYDTEAKRPIEWLMLENNEVLGYISRGHGQCANNLAIEMIASYGMPVGHEVFDTCVWIGRFIQCWGDDSHLILVKRGEVKLHLCKSSRAKDANVRQALLDKYGSTRALAIGKKDSPGPLYGISGDGWAALGVAVTVAENAPDFNTYQLGGQ